MLTLEGKGFWQLHRRLFLVRRKIWWVMGSLLVLAVLVPGAYLVLQRSAGASSQELFQNDAYIVHQPASAARIVVPQQVATPTPVPTPQPTPTPSPTADVGSAPATPT